MNFLFRSLNFPTLFISFWAKNSDTFRLHRPWIKERELKMFCVILFHYGHYAHNVVFIARQDGAQKTQVRLLVQENYALGQVKMDVWWSAGRGKLITVVSL